MIPATKTKDIMMSIVVRSVIVVVAALTSVSAASARSPNISYDSGTIVSEISDINTPEGGKTFWEVMQRRRSH